ncbi:hypothetical protein EVAR_47205_1 [Eumeta japonica]|uniref:Uncharacterized protein n=1 Tax=Eumeta variegata TaxID=151549 RepID=A0A4C1XVY4_EUMVA|nr:hypothetical protein EVAR_47205_1 [Eumeta japonica]
MCYRIARKKSPGKKSHCGQGLSRLSPKLMQRKRNRTRPQNSLRWIINCKVAVMPNSNTVTRTHGVRKPMESPPLPLCRDKWNGRGIQVLQYPLPARPPSAPPKSCESHRQT